MRLKAAVLTACAIGSASAIYGEVKSPDGQVFGLKDAFQNDFKIGMSFHAERLIESDPVCSGPVVVKYGS